MARLPMVGLRPSGGVDPSAAVVGPSDYGLGRVAQEVDAFAREREETRALAEEVQFEEDDAYAERVVTSFSETFEPLFSQQGAGWEGEGFARAGLATYDVAEAAVRRGDGEQRTAGQQAAIERRLDGYRLSVGQRGVRFESERAARLIAERRAAEDAAAGNRLFGQFLSEFAPAYQAADRTDETAVLAAHDAASAAVLEAAPEHLRPALRTRLEADRLQRQAAVMDEQARASQALVAADYEAAAGSLVNSVLVSPDLVDGAEPQIAALVAPLPAALRPAAERELRGQVAEARLMGLINMGETGQARQELQSGRYNSVLDPGTTAQLLNRIETAEESGPAAIVERLQMQDRVESDVLSVAETGQGVEGVSIEEVARVLGPAAAAQYAEDRAEAERLHGTLAGWDAMTAAEIGEQVEALRPEPGSPDFARASQTYELAQRRAAQVLERRREDPVGWALEASPPLRALLEQALSAETPEARQRAAVTYGRALFETFRSAGITEGRRFLPPETARSLVATYERQGAEGIEGLAQMLAGFAPRRGATASERRQAIAFRALVMAQLWEAGAEPADLAAAVDLADDPVGLGRYIAARGQDHSGVRGRERDNLESHVDRTMAPYLRSFAGQSPGAALTRGRRELAMTLALAGVASGQNPGTAAENAARTVAGGYSFVGRDGWRLPDSRRGDRGRIDAGAQRALRGYGQNDGERFYTPPDRGDGLGPAERREAYADHVMSRGRWVTAADDSGLVLMAPTLDGGWEPALNSDGRAIAYSWDQLEAHGRGAGLSPLTTAEPPPISPAGGRGGRQPIGVRQNNPGNLRPTGERWQGQTGEAGGFMVFRTPEAGIRAMAVNLLSYSRRGLDTVEEIIGRWAPPNENDTRAYIQTVARALNVRPDQRLNLRDERTLVGLMVAIARHENGGDYFTGNQFLSGARAALRGR